MTIMLLDRAIDIETLDVQGEQICLFTCCLCNSADLDILYMYDNIQVLWCHGVNKPSRPGVLLLLGVVDGLYRSVGEWCAYYRRHADNKFDVLH